MMDKLFKTSQEYDDWQQNNCRSCLRRSECEIRNLIYAAVLNDECEVPLIALQRLGKKFQIRGCDEFEPDEEFAAEAARKHKRQTLIAQIVVILAEFEKVRLDPKITGLIVHRRTTGHLPKGLPEMGRWVKIATKIVESLEKNEQRN